MLCLRNLLIAAVVVSIGPRATDADGDTKRQTQPFGERPHAIPGLIEAEHFDKGQPEYAYHDVEEKNLGVDYREQTQVDIEKRDDASNGHGVGWTRTGEWLIYTVEVTQSGQYSIEIPVASNKQGGIFHLEFDGKDVTGPIRVPDTGGWQTLKTITHKGVELKKGTYAMKLMMDENGLSGSIGDIDFLRFARTSEAP